MKSLSSYEHLEAALKHLPEIIVAMEHGDKKRAENHLGIIRGHILDAQDGMDRVVTTALQELATRFNSR